MVSVTVMMRDGGRERERRATSLVESWGSRRTHRCGAAARRAALREEPKAEEREYDVRFESPTTALWSAVMPEEHAVATEKDGPIQLKWYEMRFASIEPLLPGTSASVAPYGGRHTLTEDIWYPM